MNTSKYAFQAGLFILIAIAGAVVMIGWVADNNASAGGRVYVAEFASGQDISGLQEGAEVRLLGVKVGRVDAIDIVTHDNMDAHVHVAFSIQDDIELRDGVRIEAQAALTGGGWLNILSVGGGPALAENAVIPARSANLSVVINELRQDMIQTLDNTAKELTDTAEAVENTANEATELINQIERELDPVLADYDAFMAEATGLMGDFRGVFGDSGEDIRATLANLNSASTTLDQRLPTTLDGIDGALADITTFTDEATHFLDEAEVSLAEANELIDQATETAAGVNDLLADNRPTLDRMVTNANRAINELEGMIDDLRANPSRLVWPPDEKDLQNLGLYAAARSYAEAAEDLQLAAAALNNAAQDPTADPEELEQLRQQLLQQFEHFDQLQEEVWGRFEE